MYKYNSVLAAHVPALSQKRPEAGSDRPHTCSQYRGVKRALLMRRGPRLRSRAPQVSLLRDARAEEPAGSWGQERAAPTAEDAGG